MPKVVSAKKTGLASKVKYKAPPKRGPLWLGPEDGSPMGGISQSMINHFLFCRERFRIKYVEGLQPPRGFEKNSGYGDMWHICEESLSAKRDWRILLTNHATALCKKYPLQQEEIEKWYQVCKTQFPLYVEHWKRHPDNLQRTPLMQEQVFHVPYQLPSGRTVYLRGKFDAVDLIGKGKTAGVYLQENKTKGDIDVWKLQRQLTFDLQSMFYLVALSDRNEFPLTHVEISGKSKQETKLFIKGVRYNVIRRPLSGGRGSIVRHKATDGAKCPKCKGTGKGKPIGGFQQQCAKCEGNQRINAKPEETYESYYSRLSTIIKEDCESLDPEQNQYWFSRWKVDISQGDIDRFKLEFLNPFLEQMCDWYDWVKLGGDVFNRYATNKLHYRFPFGCYNPLTDGGGESDTDEYLMTGSTAGLVKVDTLFGELQ